jgi:hypothetical protein
LRHNPRSAVTAGHPASGRAPDRRHTLKLEYARKYYRNANESIREQRRRMRGKQARSMPFGIGANRVAQGLPRFRQSFFRRTESPLSTAVAFSFVRVLHSKFAAGISAETE